MSGPMENPELHNRVRALEKELEDFAYIVSHDLSAAFRHVSGFSELLIEDIGPDAQPHLHSHVNHVVAAAKKGEGMLEQLLAYSRAQRANLNPEPCDVAMALDRAMLVLGQDIRESRAEVSVGNAAGFVPADPELLAQVVTHVLHNAIKFRRAGVSPLVKIDTDIADGTWRMRIRDNGIGLPAVDRERLFWMFYRGHPDGPYGGYGTGLTIARRILRRHGGDLRAVEVDSGACFELSLPVGAPAPGALPG